MENQKEYYKNLYQTYRNHKECFSDSSLPLEENKLFATRQELENCSDACLAYFSNKELEEMEFDNMFREEFRKTIEQEIKRRALKEFKN